MAEHITAAEVVALVGQDTDKMVSVLIGKINSMAQNVATANNRAVAAEQGIESLKQQQIWGVQQRAQVPENGREQWQHSQFTRALSSLPKFSGKTPWLEWEVSFLNWMYANCLNGRDEGDLKNAMLLAFKG